MKGLLLSANMSLPFVYVETVEDPVRIDNKLPDAHLFYVEAIPKELTEIVEFLQEGKAPQGEKEKDPSN